MWLFTYISIVSSGGCQWHPTENTKINFCGKVDYKYLASHYTVNSCLKNVYERGFSRSIKVIPTRVITNTKYFAATSIESGCIVIMWRVTASEAVPWPFTEWGSAWFSLPTNSVMLHYRIQHVGMHQCAQVQHFAHSSLQLCPILWGRR